MPGGGSPTVLATFGTGLTQVNSPRGLAIDCSDRLFIADYQNSRIIRINTASIGTGGSRFLIAGTGGGLSPAQVRTPEGVAIDDAGNLYVADTGNSRVFRLSGGNPGTASIFAGLGTAVGQVRSPEGVTIASFSSGLLSGGPALVVSDTLNNRIQGRLLSGVTWIQIGGPLGTAVGRFNTPSKIR
jgi:hypothetical protein